MESFKLTMILLVASVCGASPAFAGTIEVEEAHAEMMAGKTDRGDMFMRITNNGARADRLYAARTMVARKAIIETSSDEMELAGETSATASLLLGPGETVELTEEGAHIELLDLSKRFEDGATFTATLYFEQAGPVEITVTVGDEH